VAQSQLDKDIEDMVDWLRVVAEGLEQRGGAGELVVVRALLKEVECLVEGPLPVGSVPSQSAGD